MTEKRNVVAFERGRRRGETQRIELLETARRLAGEREVADERVSRLLRTTPREEWPALAEPEELRNSGAVERLLEEVHERVEKEPREALTLSNLATSISETLPSEAYPQVILAQLRAQAWKERANALRYLGRYREAIDAIDRAEERLEGFVAVAHDRAVVQLARAIILFQTARFDAALELLVECRGVFADHGDARNVLSCGLIEGNILYEQKHYGEAEAAFTPLLAEARTLGDAEAQARLHNNLGYCASHLGRTSAANIHFSEAVAGFRNLGLDAEVMRTQRGAGAALVARGALFSGLTYLADARASLVAIGMVEEGGLCGLEIAEALLSRGDHQKAASIAGEVAADFAAAHLDHRVVQALQQLRTAVESREASPESVRQLHDYIVHQRDEAVRQSTAM